ncbi:hypothetical protein [Methanococcoides sp. NM1]|uniref:hypothetical protein n=1 Tax=Methanococcoides sp. NM1 TaxID=1201013 RepID=UPI0010838BD1|nr:hypothetical protein [Methanococcoides sp. NM1]
MYEKTTCPHCSKTFYQNLRVRVREDVYQRGSERIHKQTVTDVEMADSLSEEQLARDILLELEGYVYNGMTTDEFCKLLKKYFGVASKYCCDLIQRMKIELDMYCPDHQHLYFVEA